MREYATVFRLNLANPCIDIIHVLAESQEAAEFYKAIAAEFSTKAVFTVVGHQPTYKEIIEYIKNTIPSNQIVCLLNGDIFFNSEKDCLCIQKYLQRNHLFALTRHEITNEGHTIHTEESCPFTVHGGSCDTYLFYTPISSNVEVSRMDFHQNLFGAENVFMKCWVDAGYQLWNPCDDIITLHLHKDRIHFERYDTINTAENSVVNLKTPLPSIPSHTDI